MLQNIRLVVCIILVLVVAFNVDQSTLLVLLGLVCVELLMCNVIQQYGGLCGVWTHPAISPDYENDEFVGAASENNKLNHTMANTTPLIHAPPPSPNEINSVSHSYLHTSPVDLSNRVCPVPNGALQRCVENWEEPNGSTLGVYHIPLRFAESTRRYIEDQKPGRIHSSSSPDDLLANGNVIPYRTTQVTRNAPGVTLREAIKGEMRYRRYAQNVFQHTMTRDREKSRWAQESRTRVKLERGGLKRPPITHTLAQVGV